MNHDTNTHHSLAPRQQLKTDILLRRTGSSTNDCKYIGPRAAKEAEIESAEPCSTGHLPCPETVTRYVLKCHHERLNKAARRPEAEAYVERNLAPGEVIQVTPRNSFVP